ncbi:MAG: two-component sensor histidine kinase [Proteobacteria bacterium]|nr:two-component sensor histidine kinase [Pseudomonadota bacterium]
MNSIRKQLLLWLLSALVIAVGVATVVTGLRVDHEIDTLFDYQIKQVSILLLHEPLSQLPIILSNEPQPISLQAQTLGHSLDKDRDDRLITEVRTLTGHLLYTSHPDIPLPRHLPLGYSVRSLWNSRYRIYVAQNAARRVVVAQAISAREELAAQMAMQIALQLLGLIPVLAILIWVAVGRGMKPLAKITRLLQDRDSYTLDSLPEEGLPQEIRPMVEALNDLLQRLGEALQTQRRFTADAAHELRTPLAALQLQVQIVERTTQEGEERQQALNQLKRGIRRAAHLVQQLLTLSRLDPKTSTRQDKRPVDLAQMVLDGITGFTPLAEAKGVTLVPGRMLPGTIRGDKEALTVLLNNLLDNAIRYTPEGGRVEAGLNKGEPDEIMLWVEDTGPGIPVEERERVFDRFYRCLGNKVTGSGLGLAIVKNICEDHQARVHLDTSPSGGLKVTVTFASILP